VGSSFEEFVQQWAELPRKSREGVLMLLELYWAETDHLATDAAKRHFDDLSGAYRANADGFAIAREILERIDCTTAEPQVEP
jgi:hypothetical protein